MLAAVAEGSACRACPRGRLTLALGARRAAGAAGSRGSAGLRRAWLTGLSVRSVVDTVIFKVEEKRERFPGGPVRRGGDLAFRLRPAADDSSVQAGFSVQSNGWAYISSCNCQATR